MIPSLHFGLTRRLRAGFPLKTLSRELSQHRLDPSVSPQANAEVFQRPDDFNAFKPVAPLPI